MKSPLSKGLFTTKGAVQCYQTASFNQKHTTIIYTKWTIQGKGPIDSTCACKASSGRLKSVKNSATSERRRIYR